MCAGVGEKEEERDCYRCSAGITHHCGGGCMVARPRRRRDQIEVRGITKASEYKHRNKLSMQKKNILAKIQVGFFSLKRWCNPTRKKGDSMQVPHATSYPRGHHQGLEMKRRTSNYISRNSWTPILEFKTHRDETIYLMFYWFLSFCQSKSIQDRDYPRQKETLSRRGLVGDGVWNWSIIKRGS